MLIHFISDYIRQDALRRRFASHPAQVLAEYGVSEEQKQCLRSHDRAGLRAAVTADIDTLSPGGELQPLWWGSSDMRIEAVEPPRTSAQVSTEVLVTGQNFPAGARLLFGLPGRERVEATNVTVTTEPNGTSKLAGTVTFSVSGKYQVVVVDANGDNTAVASIQLEVTSPQKAA